jgi:hypothetical protein
MTSPIETNFGSVSGEVTISVTDLSSINPLNIIRMDDQWRVTVSWYLDGFLASMLDGTWHLVLYMEGLGPLPEYALWAQDIDFSTGVIPANPTRLEYTITNTFGPNNPDKEGVYKLLAVLTCKTPAGTPGPFAGFDAAALLQFFDAS